MEHYQEAQEPKIDFAYLQRLTITKVKEKERIYLMDKEKLEANAEPTLKSLKDWGRLVTFLFTTYVTSRTLYT